MLTFSFTIVQYVNLWCYLLYTVLYPPWYTLTVFYSQKIHIITIIESIISQKMGDLTCIYWIDSRTPNRFRLMKENKSNSSDFFGINLIFRKQLLNILMKSICEACYQCHHIVKLKFCFLFVFVLREGDYTLSNMIKAKTGVIFLLFFCCHI